MAVPVPLLRQPPGSNRCLVLAVLAVLRSYGDPATEEDVSAWCDERREGCSLYAAVEGLRHCPAEYDIEDLTGCSEEEVTARVTDAEQPLPVIVTILPHLRIVPQVSDHAVVVVDVEVRQTSAGAAEEVVYMDPLTGQYERAPAGVFWRWWDYAGCSAFVIHR